MNNQKKEKEHNNLMSRSSIISSLTKGETTLHSNVGLIEFGGGQKTKKKEVEKKKKGVEDKKKGVEDKKKGGNYSVDPTSLTNYEGYNYYVGGKQNQRVVKQKQKKGKKTIKGGTQPLGVNYILNTQTNLLQGGKKNKKTKSNKSLI